MSGIDINDLQSNLFENNKGYANAIASINIAYLNALGNVVVSSGSPQRYITYINTTLQSFISHTKCILGDCYNDIYALFGRVGATYISDIMNRTWPLPLTPPLTPLQITSILQLLYDLNNLISTYFMGLAPILRCGSLSQKQKAEMYKEFFKLVYNLIREFQNSIIPLATVLTFSPLPEELTNLINIELFISNVLTCVENAGSAVIIPCRCNCNNRCGSDCGSVNPLETNPKLYNALFDLLALLMNNTASQSLDTPLFAAEATKLMNIIVKLLPLGGSTCNIVVPPLASATTP